MTLQAVFSDSLKAPGCIGIIGGEGQFGSWWATHLKPTGSNILVSDLGSPVSNRDLASQADAILLSVPMGAVTAVVEEIKDLLTPDRLLIDLASVKTPFVSSLLSTAAEVVGLHLMFAPTVPSPMGQSCIVCELRPGQYTPFFLSVLRGLGIQCATMTAQEHDETMAVVQGLTHFQAITAAHALVGLGVDPGKTLDFASPVYRMRLAMIGRILAQNAVLYGEIQTLNPYVPKVLETLRGSVDLFERAVVEGDLTTFVGEFDRVKDELGGFTQKALLESTRWLKAMTTVKEE